MYIIRDDFHIKIGEEVKVYPFLIQKNFMIDNNINSYLNIGQSELGMVYFEQNDSFGKNSPKIYNNRVTLKIKVLDVFGNRYYKKLTIPFVNLEYARKYNPSFGKTIDNS